MEGMKYWIGTDVGRDLHRHLAMRAVIDHARRIEAAIPIAAVDARADIAPGAEQLVGQFAVSHAAPAGSVNCRSPCHRNVLGLGELHEALMRAFAAESGLFDAA